MMKATPQEIFFSRNNPLDPRLGDLVAPISMSEIESQMPGFVIAGYPDDEGIKLNDGRVGAALAPNVIRKYLYKMTPDFSASETPRIMDLGNIDCQDELELRHQRAKELATSTFEKGHRWVALGGGHDYGYADAAAFLDTHKNSKQKPLVINFDAHLDVRSLDRGLSSGTPFFRLLSQYSDFYFAEIGIQNQCNSQHDYQWCMDQGGRVLTFEEILTSGLPPVIKVMQFLEDWLIHKGPTFISIDIDGFALSYAMGCSQSWPTGFEPNSFFPLLETLLQRLDVRGLGIYEVSPPLDQDDRTSKLAAQIIHRFLFSQP